MIKIGDKYTNRSGGSDTDTAGAPPGESTEQQAPAARIACRCRCGYRCGGPGICKLGVFECLQQPTGHFVVDCGHDWNGPVWTSEDQLMSSVTCSACHATRIHHDIRVGP